MKNSAPAPATRPATALGLPGSVYGTPVGTRVAVYAPNGTLVRAYLALGAITPGAALYAYTVAGGTVPVGGSVAYRRVTAYARSYAPVA